jgi:Permuted papain-like amidase enzyme, YaeF/YiiX, C92 family
MKFGWIRWILLAGMCAASIEALALPEGLDNDVAVIKSSRHGLAAITTYMASQPDLFPARAPSQLRALTPLQRREVKDIWGRFVDYELMLDALWQRLSADPAGADDEMAPARARVAYTAFLARYRYALDFIDRADADPALRVVLNEPLPDLGLPAHSYADFKFRFLNVAMAAEFASLAAVERSRDKDDAFPLAAEMSADEARIWKAGVADGVVNTLRNAGQIGVNSGARLVFPVQKGVSEWMGDTRVLYGSHYLIAPDQIAALTPRLRPGDLLLERREWFLSNIGLPGYWPHVALYVGTAQERAAYFDDPAVRAWLATQGVVDGDFEALLKRRYPRAYGAGEARDEHGNAYRVMEAMSEGVVFTAIEHSAAADSLAVLRPRLPRLAVAKALLKAYSYQGRPYDFDFDFRTDATLVCSELAYKAYAPDAGKRGLDLPLRTVAGRPVLTPNDIAQQFDQSFGSARQQFDLVAFLDGQARSDRAVEADLAQFRASWRRPKWHILTQNTPLGEP